MGALQRLALALFIDAQNQCILWWTHVKSDDIQHFLHEMRIGGKLEGFRPVRREPDFGADLAGGLFSKMTEGLLSALGAVTNSRCFVGILNCIAVQDKKLKWLFASDFPFEWQNLRLNEFQKPFTSYRSASAYE